MRKLLCVILSVVMVLATSVCGFGAVKPGDGAVSPQYVATNRVSAQISIVTGVSVYSAKAYAKTADSIDYIKATLKLVDSKGNVVKTKTETVYESGGYFKITDTKALSSKGTYHAEYTLKVYKSGSLVETIKGQSETAKY